MSSQDLRSSSYLTMIRPMNKVGRHCLLQSIKSKTRRKKGMKTPKKMDYVNSLYERIVGAVCFSSQKIIEIINTFGDHDYKIFPLPSPANPYTLGETLFRLIYDIWEHSLNNYHAVTLRLQEFKAHDQGLLCSDPTFSVLDNLGFSLAKFLSKFYVELDRYDPWRPSAPALLLHNIHKYFLDLEREVGVTQLGSLLFEPLPFEHNGCLDHDQLNRAVHVMLSNLSKLDEFLSFLLTNHHEPKIKSRRWMYYTFGAIGISVISMWLLRDSRLSSMVNNWVLGTKDSTVRYLSDNVVQPLTFIRDGLFEAYRDSNSNTGVIESERLQATSDLLHSKLLDFGKRTGLKFPPNASDQEMFNMVENSFEQQFRHPIRSLLGGVSARSMLIHLLKLNLEVEKTIPGLIYHLSLATQSKFVILALIWTVYVSVGVGIPSYALVKLGTRMTNKKKRIAQAQRTRLLLNVEKYVKMQKISSSSQLRGTRMTNKKKRIAQAQRTRLLLNVEKYVKMQKISSSSQLREDPDYVNGLLLYSLDQLYRVVKKHSKTLPDWQADWIRWRREIVFLGEPNAETSQKLRSIDHFKMEVPYLFSLESLNA